MITLAMLLLTMLVGYITFKHEHREEVRIEAYLYRHRNDADKLAATADVAAAYNELIATGLIK